MELKIGSNEVFLSLHPTYCSEDDGKILLQVSEYPPLVQWLTKYHPEASNFVLSSVTVRNIQWIAKRLLSVTADVEISTKESESTNGDKPNSITQSVTFTEEPQAVLLPLIMINGFEKAILIKQRRVALGGNDLEEAFIGTITKDGFQGVGANTLSELGFDLSTSNLTRLCANELSFGDGLPTCTIHKVTKVMTATEMSEFLGGGIGSTSAKEFEGGAYSLSVHSLDEIVKSGADLKALTAASLVRAA
eukprot:Tbor_TRINITY_DN6042_c2_g1::TRINITY_DN6042_c2_g1_i1::g.10638::m.10638